jgi:glyoxylate reductase
VAVCNTPDVLTDTTADLAMALLLACARRLVEADAYTRAGRFKVWAPLLLVGADVHHKTLGVLGLGRIGQAMARRAGGFDMRVIYHGRRRAAPEVESACRAEYVSLETLLKESDFISLHVPLTPETRRLIGPAELAAMKPGAFLINTTRGEVVDEAALTDALREGRIAGAGLDVYENEPELCPGLTELNNVVLAPHIGSASLETRTGMGIMADRNLMAALIEGVRPPNCLNPEVYDRAAK